MNHLSKFLFAIPLVVAIAGCDVKISENGDITINGKANCEALDHNESILLHRYSAPSVAADLSCDSVQVDVTLSCSDGDLSYVPSFQTYESCTRRDPAGEPDPVDPQDPEDPQDPVDPQDPEDPSDVLAVFRAIKGQQALDIIDTTAAFQSRSFTASNKFKSTFFYARNADNSLPNTVVALSDRNLVAGQANSFDQAAVTVRCNSGAFQARGASGFQDLNFPCVIGKAYMIEVTVDGTARTYKVAIENNSGASIPAAQQPTIGFRSSYTGGAALSTFNVVSDRASSDGDTRFDRVTEMAFLNLASPGGGTPDPVEPDPVEPQDPDPVDPTPAPSCPNSNSVTPTEVAFFGPNGTHWPKMFYTPFMYDFNPQRVSGRVQHIITINPSWTAIKNALNAVTSTQAAEGTMILINPGTIVGPSSKSNVMDQVGNKSWSKRVTVAPKNGYGSVVFTGKPIIEGMYKVALAGFKFDSLWCKDCSQSAIAWSRVDTYLQVSSKRGSALAMQDVEVVEVAMPDSKVISDDTFDIYAATGDINNVHIIGSYFAPRFFEYPYTGGKPHTDTFQIAATDGGDYTNLTIRDSVFYSSNNCSIQVGNLDGLLFENSIAISGSMSLSRYPHLPGGATEATTNAYNGSGKNFVSKNSIVIGGMGLNDKDSSQPWSSVINTKTNKAYGALNQPGSGSWTVTNGLENTQAHPIRPTDARLNEIWSNPCD